MGLLELNPKGFYDSDLDDLVSDFYVPVLQESIIYKRIAGYFSSNSFAISARGISKLIENKGKMYLIANIVLSEEDQEAIKKAIEEREKEILDEIENVEDFLKKGHLQLLAWMIKSGTLEIKIAVVPNGIEHKKKGILEDFVGNIISFSGSDNETVSGWLYNHEDFHVFCSWIPGDKERHLDHDLISFEDLWNNRANRVKVFEISDAFRLGLIQKAPKNEEEFRVLSNELADELISKHRQKHIELKKGNKRPSRHNIYQLLREYQAEAISKWETNGRKGILQMATGTGKTFTAIAAMERYLEERDRGIVVIVAPKKLLVSQWANELRELGYSNVIEIMENSSKWRQDLNGSLIKMELGREKEVIAVATYISFCSENFKRIMLLAADDILLICDEMHNSWAPKYRSGFLHKYQSRLGLSATPERYMDEIGTKEMQEYFGGIVYNFGINQAIPEFLVPYEYHAEIVELTDEEKSEYDQISIDIARKIAANDGAINESILLMILSRAKIVINSESKWKAFEKILDELSDIKKTLIYCSDRQINRVLRILHSRKIAAHKITYREPLKHRKEIIDLFNSADYKAIVAIKVLDEGIDVPGIEKAIVLASSGNPIEYIQRRGRILRKSRGKDFASIYDILIFPWLDIPYDISSAELSMLKKEIKRIDEFASSATNPLEVINKIAKYKSLIDSR